MGIAQVFASLFSCHCCSAALSRSVVFEDQNARTGLADIFNASIILLVLVALAHLFGPLPTVIQILSKLSK